MNQGRGRAIAKDDLLAADQPVLGRSSIQLVAAEDPGVLSVEEVS
jgi:hypothetical protein